MNDADQTAFVVSANIRRRHMDKGQLAMAEAMLRPEPEKGGRGKKSSKIEGLATGYISMARTVLLYSIDGDLARDVMSGAKS